MPYNAIEVLPKDEPMAPPMELPGLPKDDPSAALIDLIKPMPTKAATMAKTPGLPQDEAPAPPMELEKPEEILLSSLSPAEQKNIQDQVASQPAQSGEVIDMVDTLTAQELADLFIKSGGDDFNIGTWAAAHPDATPEQTDKVADALAIAQERGAKFSDIKWKEVLPALGHMVTGAGKFTGRALEIGIVDPIGRAVAPKLTPAAKAEFDAIQAKKSAELVASTETGLFGMAELAKKGAKLAARQVGKVLPEAVKDFLFLPSFNAQFMKKPIDRTPQERRDALWELAGDVTQQQNVAKGHGAATGTLLAGPIKDLEAKGYKIDPEVVGHMAAGDPITFYAFGKGFQVAVMTAGKVAKVVANVSSKTEAGALVAALNSATRAAAKAGAEESRAAGAAARGLETEVAQAAQIGKTAFPAQAGVLTAEATPALSAALDTAAETAAAARAAELAARSAGEAVAASPVARTLAAAGKLPPAIVEAKAKVAAALGGAVERGIDKAAALAPGVAGVGLKTASWLAKTVGEHPLAAYAIAGGGTAGLGGAGASAVGKAYAPAIGRAGKAATEAAKQLAKGESREFGAGARAISSAAQMFPAIAGGAARGAVVDAALAAATSETAEDMAHAPMFMTAHGALRGANIGLLRGVQRQLIGERDIQSASRSAGRGYGDFPSLDAANKFTVEQLAKDQPNKVRRLSAIRDFLNPTGAQMYWIPETSELVRVLKEVQPGLSEARYAEMAAQRALNITVNGKKLAIVKDLDAGPHEAMHPWQEVMSEEAMNVIDQITYDNYAPYWEAIGENYARQFFGSEYVAALKARGEGWREGIIDLATGKTDWRGQLSDADVQGFSNQYIARELSAEVGDAIFKQGGPELLNDKSFAGKIARIIAKTYSGLGMEPFEGAVTEGQGVPLKFEATEKIRKALTRGIEEFKVEAARPGTAAPVSPRVTVSPRGERAPAAPANPRDVAATAPEEPTVRGGRTQREIATDIADAIESGSGLSVDYMSAPGEPAGAITSNRAARRDIIEAFRNMPAEARVLWEKNFFPDQFVRAGGKIQVMGWSPEVFAANAHKLAKALQKPGTPPIPYEIDRKTGTFTARGWQELFTDTANFVKNQNAGLSGAGEPLVVPAETAARGFTAPEARGEAGVPLDQRRADIISALFGVPIPKTPRVGQVYPRNLAGQEVSAATRPGRLSVPVEPRAPFAGERAEEMGIAGREIQEVNPFRAELDAANVKPSFIEALQRLNLENIADVGALPEGVQPIRGREFTLQAGFQPKKEPRAVKEAAIRLPTGEIFTGSWHGEASNKYQDTLGDISFAEFKKLEQAADFGFVTNAGEFLTRDAALERAESLKQLSPRAGREFGAGLESVGFDTMRKFQPSKGREEAERFAALSPSEFVKEIKSVKRGMTNQAWDLGRSLSLEEVPRLREAEAAARAKWKEAMDAGDMPEAIAASSQKQFFNEAARFRDALEEAKGVTDPAKLREIEQKFGVGDLVPKNVKFQPKPNDPRAIRSAAVRDEAGKIWEGLSHYAAQESIGKKKVTGELEDGFVDNRGNFLNRDEAYKRAVEINQGFMPPDKTEAHASNFLYRPDETAKFQPSEKQEGTGLGFKKFFSDVSQGKFGKSEVPFEPLQDMSDVAAVQEARAKHVGNFEHHIDKSIPLFHEQKTRVIDGIQKTFGEDGARVLDIAGSEGDFGKTITELSNGKITTVNLDPNPEMAKAFREISEVPGATVAEESFLTPFTDEGRRYVAHKPEAPYDVINESMGFQFISPDRNAQIAEVKSMLAPDGVFITAEKFKNPQWAANEAKKDAEFKSKYFSSKELKEKDTRVGFAQSKKESQAVGMVDNMVEQSAFEKTLTDNFDHVVQYYDSGNFKGYLASDSAATLKRLADNIGDLNSDFSTVETPRNVAGEAKFAVKKGESELKLKSTASGYPSKGWILPDGSVQTFGATWHGQWLQDNPGIQKKYKLDVTPSADQDRGTYEASAIRTGFARVNYEPRNGKLTVEARAKDWPKIKDKVFDIVEENLGQVDKLEVHLLDEAASDKPVDSVFGNLFQENTTADKLAKVQETIDAARTGEVAVTKAAKGGPSNIAIARARFAPSDDPRAVKRAAVRDAEGRIFEGTYHGDAIDNAQRRGATKFSDYSDPSWDVPYEVGFVTNKGEYLSRDEAYSRGIELKQLDPDKVPDYPEFEGVVHSRDFKNQGAKFQPGDELPGFESPPAAPKYDKKKISEMTRQELREHFPEAVVPRAKDETVSSDIVGSPLYKKSKTEAKAVEAFADRLVEFAKEYKDDPAYKVGEEWYSEFTPKMKKEFGDDAPIFAELLAATSPNTPPGTNFKFAYDAIESYKAKRFAKQLPKFHEGLAKLADGSWETWMTENRPDAKQSTQRFMAEWIKEYDLKPRQTNGKLYGLHSTRVLQVFARKWLETTKGPKTRNFVENLIGTSDEATIDLWADRTMRWAGYEGMEERWRILPEYGKGVSNKDFAFAQKAFKAAADKMGIKSSALQGALWFAEKKRWADKGWGKLDLGSFSTEMEKIPKLKKGFEERMKKKTEQQPLDIQGRFD